MGELQFLERRPLFPLDRRVGLKSLEPMAAIAAIVCTEQGLDSIQYIQLRSVHIMQGEEGKKRQWDGWTYGKDNPNSNNFFLPCFTTLPSLKTHLKSTSKTQMNRGGFWSSTFCSRCIWALEGHILEFIMGFRKVLFYVFTWKGTCERNQGLDPYSQKIREKYICQQCLLNERQILGAQPVSKSYDAL